MTDRPAHRLGLRPRVALFFVALALGGTAALGAGLWLGHARAGGPAAGYVLAGVVAALGLAGLCAWVALLFDENVAQPILALASDMTTRARADVDLEIDEAQARHLGALAPAANAINAALAQARAAQARTVARETARINREKALFEALFRDLGEGAIVATPDHRVMLYNRMAQTLLGEIGLDRPLHGVLRPEPVYDALRRMAQARAQGLAGAESFLAATAAGDRFILGRISLIDPDGELTGHVLIFRDATEDLRTHAERDHLFNSLLEGVRRPAATIGSLLDALDSGDDLPPETRARFRQGMQDEVARLFDCLSEMGQRHGAAKTRNWPMSPVAVAHVFDGVGAQAAVPVQAEPDETMLHCDGFAIAALLARLADSLAGDDSRHDLRLWVEADAAAAEARLCLGWQGEGANDGLVSGWLQQPLAEAYGDYCGRDALRGHQTEIWSESLPEPGTHRLVLPLALAIGPSLAPGDARPEFYDFNLPAPPGPEMAARALADLPYVVFDTETTGLSPRGGDEIVQIAGVRIVNGRILRGEVFDTLVDPRRPIPPASSRVHHITDAMVAGAPQIDAAGRRFHDFCDGAVLVAHNAPFDLAFLRRKEAVIGRRFDNPVLCTVLMSAVLFDHTGQHTLDALCDRFGVIIPPDARHTALGDAMATAEVFVQMLSLLRGRGITTLGGAIAEENRMTRIRRAQAY